jgi:hypothetical protein
VLALYAARFVWALRRRGRRLACLLGGLALVCSFVHCLAFLGIYRSRHPWLAASEWLYDHAEPGAVIAVEQWDHPLPLDGAGYAVRELPLFEEDTADKWAVMDDVLSEADYVIVASRRGYGTLARWPERYPLTARYYHRLFEGDLGFQPVACFGRFARLGRLILADDPTRGLDFSLPGFCRPEPPDVLVPLGRLDESFVVYDHPRVVILRREPRGGEATGMAAARLPLRGLLRDSLPDGIIPPREDEKAMEIVGRAGHQRGNAGAGPVGD